MMGSLAVIGGVAVMALIAVGIVLALLLGRRKNDWGGPPIAPPQHHGPSSYNQHGTDYPSAPERPQPHQQPQFPPHVEQPPPAAAPDAPPAAPPAAAPDAPAAGPPHTFTDDDRFREQNRPDGPADR